MRRGNFLVTIFFFMSPTARSAASRAGTPMRLKVVYVNEVAVGKAGSWAQANALLAIKGIHFAQTPKRTEGPSGFYLQGPLLGSDAGANKDAKNDQGVA